MKISVATNFDHQLIPQIASYPVYEVYGKLAEDWLGGGRSSYMIPFISKNRLKHHIELVHQYKIRFNYLLNAACLDNMEFNRKGQKKIYAMLEHLTDIGVDSLTITMPYLLRLVKRNFPHFNVRASIFSNIDSVEKAKWWADYGADTLCLNDINTNREFKVLRAIRKAVSCDIQLLANNSCLQNCGIEHYHQNLISHSSQAKHTSKGFVIDYCFLTCSKKRLEHPINYVRGTWIRPEDLHIYEEMGIDNFKIVERSSPTAVLVNRVRAYANRSYDGNLLDLVQPIAYSKTEENKKAFNTRPNLYRLFKTFFRPDKVRLTKLGNVKKAAEKMGALFPLDGSPKVEVNNKSLDGFLQRFPTKGCRDRSCEECLYCYDWANKVVKIDKNYLKGCLNLVNQINDDLETGSMFFKRSRLIR